VSTDEEPVRKGSADHPHSAAPSYSSLLSGGASPASAALDSGAASGQGFQDAAHPFRYSKEQMLVVWKESGPNKSVLGAEVARWPGIVRDTITEPVGLRELTAEEKKARAIPYFALLTRCPCGAIPANALSNDRYSRNPLIPIPVVVITLVGMV
jgi:hypothetical protein